MATKRNPRAKELLSFLNAELFDYNAFTPNSDLTEMIKNLERALEVYEIRMKEKRLYPTGG